ncbi:hypothetical protein KVR01_012989 [Diaporthe batatas]|uniref:uncharacterized protein n=1 Tax=Diaporthe batatas TaxID=748121 RepID=UPI001D048EDC|nr:uncharacterized protein KVR01_012989 [Diaporthe batatas]KAG8157281.1 hypothetical protein KVR01_012989 [Diaporthe batatas]
MLVRDFRRFALVLGSAILLVLLCVRLVGPAGTETLLGLQVGDWPGGGGSPTSPEPLHEPPFEEAAAAQALALAQSQQSTLTDGSKGLNDAPLVSSPPPPPTKPSRFIGPNGEIVGFQPPSEVRPGGSGVPHTEIFSVSTKDRRYFPIRMGSAKVLNPNIIPHPRLEAAWIVVAQKMGDRDEDDREPGLAVEPSLELVCTAIFIDGALTCIEADGRGFGEPTTLPVQPTSGDGTKCTGDLEFFNLNVGPHDARVFYGPRDPYTIYGSNSNFNCFGQWIRDFRGLVPEAWGGQRSSSSSSSNAADEDDWMKASSSSSSSGSTWPRGPPAAHDEFASPNGTELQRPPPYGAVEKNWFLFWDSDNVHYVHYDMTPRRAFARLNGDGSVGEDLGAGTGFAPARDNACLARYLPDLAGQQHQHQGPGFHESLHQATNSLSVTLCRRADPGCTPDDGNTFVFAVVHHKVYRDFHSVYEPYVVVFRQRAPFEVFAVGARPLWVSGRQTTQSPGRAESSEMFYVTSISWKTKGLRYHGYVDDVMFLAFGIEDERAAGIDVQAGSMLANLGLCDDGEGLV